MAIDSMYKDGDILREGYLFKQKRGVLKLWKARYFALRKNGLYYYKQKGDLHDAPLGSISFKDIAIHLEEMGEKHRKYCIRITEGKKTYCLCCFSEEERNTWVTAVLAALTNYHMEERDQSESEFYIPEYTDGRRPRGKGTLPRSRSLDMLNNDSTTKRRSETMFASRPDLSTLFRSDLEVPRIIEPFSQSRSPRNTPRAARKLKALSVSQFGKWRNSYIDLS